MDILLIALFTLNMIMGIMKRNIESALGWFCALLWFIIATYK